MRLSVCDRRECNEIIHNSQHFIFLQTIVVCIVVLSIWKFSIVCMYVCVCILMPFPSPNCGNKTWQHCNLTQVQFPATSPLLCFFFIFFTCFQSLNCWLAASNRTTKYLSTHYRQDINCINQFNNYLWWISTHIHTCENIIFT